MKENELKVLEIIDTMSLVSEKLEIDFYNDYQNPLFLASDVAAWLKIQNVSQMIKQADLEDDQKGIFLKYTLGGEQKALFVTEDGLYDILMTSRKSNAKILKKEIKSYLKQIRLTGGVVQEGREEEFVNNNFSSFSEETKKYMVNDLIKANEEYKQKLAEQEPIVQAYKDLMTAKGYLQFIDVAAMVETGRTKLFEFLRKKKVLTKQSNFNIPYGRFNTNGMFKVVTEETKNGHISSVTMVSPKGLNYIYKLIKKNDMLDEFDISKLLEVQNV